MLVSFSGPHGAGKSTLMQEVARTVPGIRLYPEDSLSFPKVTGNYYERCKAKMLRYYFETLDQQRFATEAETVRKGGSGIINGAVLCNRCIYDTLAYVRAYEQIRWLTSLERKKLELAGSIIFSGSPEDFRVPQNLIILNPSLETLQRQLRLRWAKGVKKWNEENLEYLAAVREEFAAFYRDGAARYAMRMGNAQHTTLAQPIVQPMTRSAPQPAGFPRMLYLADEPLEEKVRAVEGFISRQLAVDGENTAEGNIPGHQYSYKTPHLSQKNA